MTTVTFIDTSVLCELLQVPGKCEPERRQDHWDELDVRVATGERMIVPITTVIETGNHIAQSGPTRYEVATRFVAFLRQALGEGSPFLVPRLVFGPEFVAALCDGDWSGQTLADLASSKVGAGDIAILVQRDQVRSSGDFSAVDVWTLDHGLHQLASST